MRFDRIFSLVVIFFVFPQVHAIVLTEVMFDPAGEEGSDEFIELYNESSLPVNLSNWSLSDGEGTDIFVSIDDDLIAAPHQYILILDPDYIEDQSTTYDGLVPENALVITIDNSTLGSRGLSNSENETISIINNQSQTIAHYTYSIGNLSGHSDEKILLNGDDSTGNWGNSLTLHGSPGSRNSLTPSDFDLAVIDFYADPPTPEPSESFRLVTIVKNLGLYPLTDSLVISEMDPSTGEIFQIIERYNTGLLSPADSIEFAVSLTMNEQSVRFFQAELQTDDGNPDNNLRETAVGENAGAGPLMFNEIMYRPLEGHSEWIELANVSNADLGISGWSFADGTAWESEEDRVTLPALTIPANNFLILAADSIIFLEQIPDSAVIVVWNNSIPSLNNSGDSLFLFDESHQLQDRVDYNPHWGNDEEGISLERISLLSPTNSETNWSFSLDESGSTPGAINSRALMPPSGMKIPLTLEPNPFSPDGDGLNDLLAIRYNLEHADSRLDIKIFDTRGRTVRFLSNNEPAGYFGERLWNGEDDSGQLLPTGLYIVYLEALGVGGTRIQTNKRPVALIRKR